MPTKSPPTPTPAKLPKLPKPPEKDITLAKLCEWGACSRGKNEFRALFPTGVDVTRRLARKHAHRIPIFWLVARTLGDTARAEFGGLADAAYHRYCLVNGGHGNYARYDRDRASAWAHCFIQQKKGKL